MTRFRILNWWIAKKLDSFHLVLAILGISISIAGYLAGFPYSLSAGFRFLLILTALHLIHYNLHQFGEYLKNYRSIDRLPLGQMKQVNRFFLVLFLLAFLFAVFLGTFLPWKEIGRFLWNPIRILLTWLIQFLQGTKEMEAAQEQGTGIQEMLSHLPVSPTSVFARILEAVIYLAFYVFLIFAAVWLLVLGIKRAAEYISRFHWDEDEKVFLKPEVLEEELKEKKKNSFWKSRLSFLDQSRNGKIRRIYRDYIKRKLSEKNSLPYLTPAQLEQRAGLPHEPIDEEKKRAFHQIYEQARYSKNGGSKKEMERMREIEKALAISEKTSYNFL